MNPRDPIDQLHLLAWVEAIHSTAPSFIPRQSTWDTMQLFIHFDPEGFEEFVHETVHNPEHFLQLAQQHRHSAEMSNAAKWN